MRLALIAQSNSDQKSKSPVIHIKARLSFLATQFIPFSPDLPESYAELNWLW